MRISLVWPAAKLVMFCRIDSKSVLSLFTEMQLSTDFAHRAHNQCIKVDNSTQMITEVDLDIQAAARGNATTSSVD